MSEEEILYILQTRLTLEVHRDQHGARIALMLDGEPISEIGFLI